MGKGSGALLLLLLLFQRINPSVKAEYTTRSADKNTNLDTFSRGMTPPPLPFCCRRCGDPRPFADKGNTMVFVRIKILSRSRLPRNVQTSALIPRVEEQGYTGARAVLRGSRTLLFRRPRAQCYPLSFRRPSVQ
ncbi:unnamed protein product, partial [Ectocarpus sp. 8 AP-2014]